MKSLIGEDVVNQALNLLNSRDIEKDGDADRCSGTTSMVETLLEKAVTIYWRKR